MEDKKTRGNKKMRSDAVRKKMVEMMNTGTGEAPKDMKEQLDKASRESDSEYRRETKDMGMKKGGSIKNYQGGGYVKAADGCATQGKTRGKMV